MGVFSMTGFARTEGEADGISWAWELKSVNSRSLDLRLRLPPGFDGLEPALRASLARLCRRGNVSANLSVNRTVPPTIRINREMLAQIIALARDVAAEIEAAPPRLDGLIGLRGIVETVEDDAEPVVEARRAAVLDGWEQALRRLVAARAEEGARLAAVLDRAARRAGRARRGGGGLRRGAGPGNPRASRSAARRACRAGADHPRGAHRPGTGHARHPRRCARGARPAARPHRAGWRISGERRRGRKAARFPVPGAEPRSQHAVLEIGLDSS